jgi:hypothetical protein
MRTAEHVLAVIRDRGQRGLPLEDVYRQLYNPALYLAAYGKIYRNSGATTQGMTPETVDGMSEEKIAGIIALLREEKYRWTPVRRVYIEKKHSTRKRPSASRRGRTSCCKKSSASSLTLTTSRSSTTTPTASGPAAAAAPRFARSTMSGGA